MLLELLLPDYSRLKFKGLRKLGQMLIVELSTTTDVAECPKCETLSRKEHSTYPRTVLDLPWADWQVILRLEVKRFFCKAPKCPKVTFAERLPRIVEPYARRTARLVEKQQRFGYEMCGEVAAKVCEVIGVPTSGDTIIRLLRKLAEKICPTPRVLGVDDWAMRKGQTYGTILVDLEQHRPVDLLPDREAETLAEWLQAHPGVEIITRDRAKAYADGATQGAPEAVQVADRFHLLQNLLDVLKRMFERHPGDLQQADKQIAAELAQNGPAEASHQIEKIENSVTKVEINTIAEEKASLNGKSVLEEQPLSYAERRFADVKKLQNEGHSQREIARQLGVNRKTVSKYFTLDRLPQRVASVQSKVLPYWDYVSERWQEGCQNCQQIFLELQEKGFTGSYASVWRAVAQLPRDQSKVASSAELAQKPRRLSPRQAAWSLISKTETLSPKQEIVRKILRESSSRAAIAYDLAQDFTEMVRERKAGKLDAWLEQAENSSVVEFKRFAASLYSDYEAVKAALSLPWSNGQVEGQVHRLKLIKRQMYGRGNFDLLRTRVVGFT